MTCKNCNQIVEGNYCAHCGQSASVARINRTSFLKELSDSVFQINRGLFYTLQQLFVRPGHSIREYLAGKRKNHFKPIAYALLLSTLYFLITQLAGSGTFVNDAVEGFASGASGSEEIVKELAILNWFARNYAYTVLLLLPVYSLASRLAFSRSGFNYLEHIVLNAYIIGQQAVFYSLFVLISLVIGESDPLAMITIGISIAYTVYVFGQFFSTYSRTAVIFRTMVTYALYLLLLLPLALFVLLVVP